MQPSFFADYLDDCNAVFAQAEAEAPPPPDPLMDPWLFHDLMRVGLMGGDERLHFLVEDKHHQNLRGPGIPCVPLSEEALTPYEPRMPPSTMRSLELASQLLQRGPYSLTDCMRWAGDDVPGLIAIYCVSDVPSFPLYADLVDRSARLPFVHGSCDTPMIVARTHHFYRSLEQTGLGPEHFVVRILPLDELYTDHAKEALNTLYRPVWSIFDGFLSRYDLANPSRASTSKPSDFDALHPFGRLGRGQLERRDVPSLIWKLDQEIPNILVRFDRVETQLAAFAFNGGGTR